MGFIENTARRHRRGEEKDGHNRSERWTTPPASFLLAGTSTLTLPSVGGRGSTASITVPTLVCCRVVVQPVRMPPFCISPQGSRTKKIEPGCARLPFSMTAWCVRYADTLPLSFRGRYSQAACATPLSGRLRAHKHRAASPTSAVAFAPCPVLCFVCVCCSCACQVCRPATHKRQPRPSQTRHLKPAGTLLPSRSHGLRHTSIALRTSMTWCCVSRRRDASEN